MKKILFVIPTVPYPLNSGGNQAFFNMVDYVRHIMSVSVLFYAWSEEQEKQVEELKAIWHNVDFYVYAKERNTLSKEPLVRSAIYYKWLDKLKRSIERKMRRQLLSSDQVLSPLSNKDFVCEKSVLSESVFKGLDAKYVDYVVEVSKLGFDIIQVEFYELISLGYVLPQNVETVFVHHELRYIRNENEMALFEDVTPNDLMYYHIAKDYELNALRKYKHIIALTEVDKELLSDSLGKCVYASPAVVKLEINSNVEFVPCVLNRFTFVGYGGHFPNLDAVVWFCNEIAPCLRKRGVVFTFQVVGMGYEQYADELQESCPEIELVGFVDDLKAFLQGSIALVPIRIGSGMRMKILDMVSSSVPFITTSKGLEGINFKNAEECLIADNANAFADSMFKISTNPELQKKLVNQAKVKLKELYNPEEMLNRRMEVYKSILDEKN